MGTDGDLPPPASPNPTGMTGSNQTKSPAAGRRVGLVKAGLLAGWIMLLVLPPGVVWTLRSGWLAELDAPAIQAHWDRFRSDMEAQSDRSGPVQHKVPKSPEPPLRVWLRDYFWLAVAAWGVLGSTLYGFMSMVVVGLIEPANPGRLPAEQKAGGDDDTDEQDQGDSEHTEQ